MWQAIDLPPRMAESERTLVAAAALALFDKIIRTPAMDNPLVSSVLMGEDGGYYFSTTVSQASKDFEVASGFLELARPEHARARSDVLSYLSGIRKINR